LQPNKRAAKPADMLIALVDIADLLLSILMWIIIAQVILSWLLAFNVLNTSSGGVRAFATAIDRVTAPLYRPIRKLLPDFGGIDFSPLVILILIQVIKKLLAGVVTQYYFGG
jgi:YggT family protein